MKKIVYLQSNEEKAQEIIDNISVSSLDFVHVTEGEEVLSLLKTEEVILVWIDTDIKDMSLEELLTEIRKISGDVAVNVCLSQMDIKVFERLVNRYCVGKVYVDPKNMQDVVRDLNSTLSEIVKAENKKSEAKDLKAEQEILKKTLASLTEKLKKQQHSYTKLTGITGCLVSAVEEANLSDGGSEDKKEYIKDAYRTFIKMQTTGSFDIEKFEECVKDDFDELCQQFDGSKSIEIRSCLMGDQSKALVQNIRFSIYLIARIYAETAGEFDLKVRSHYLTTKTVEFICEMKSKRHMSEATKEKTADYRKSAEEMMSYITDNYRANDEGDKVTFYMEFPVIKKQ